MPVRLTEIESGIGAFAWRCGVDHEVGLSLVDGPRLSQGPFFACCLRNCCPVLLRLARGVAQTGAARVSHTLPLMLVGLQPSWSPVGSHKLSWP